MHALLSSCAFSIACLLVFLACKGFDRRLTLGAGLLFALYVGLDDVMTGLPSILPASGFLPGDWNWEGKVYSLLLSALVIVGLKVAGFELDRRALGLVAHVRDAKVTVPATMLLIALSTTLGLVFRPGAADLETLLFQPTMPALAEELAWRGIAPALLLSLHAGRTLPAGIPWAVVAITGIGFGLWHGLSYGASGLSFDAMSALFPLIGGLAYGWLRFRSGSLVLPILAHGLGNLAFVVAGGLAA